MTHTKTTLIDRQNLRAFFQPHVDRGHKKTVNIHILCPFRNHGAGYVGDINDHAVAKYLDCLNAITWINFSDIVEIWICDFSGVIIEHYTVTDGAGL